MRLGISNLAWAPDADAEARALLPTIGIQGIEVAPTRIAPWDDLTPARIDAYRSAWADAGLAVSSLQAVFFGRPEAALLADAAAFAAMAEHMRVVAGIAARLGAGVAVFGAPRSRLRGAMPLPDAEALAAERLHALGAIAAAGHLVLGIEPVPAVYGADFMRHASDVRRVVAATAHPNVRTHLDTACVTMEGDDIAREIAATPALAHFHIAEPELAPFDPMAPMHRAAIGALHHARYTGWTVIEMKQQPGTGLDAARRAALSVQDVYFKG